MSGEYAVIKVSELKKLASSKLDIKSFVRSASSHPVQARMVFGRDAKGHKVKMVAYYSEPQYKGFRILDPDSEEAKEINRTIDRINKAGTWVDRDDIKARLLKHRA
jgi:hypothetical protein